MKHQSFKLNGNQVAFSDNQTILEAAEEAGVRAQSLRRAHREGK